MAGPENGVDVVQGISTQAVYNLIRKREREANLTQSISPHDFRRTLLTQLLERGKDVFTVQAVAGHADPSTTKRYDLRNETHMRNAAYEVHFPYKGRRAETEVSHDPLRAERKKRVESHGESA